MLDGVLAMLAAALIVAAAAMATSVWLWRRDRQRTHAMEALAGERRRVEGGLRDSEAQAAAVLESAGEAVLVADRSGLIVLANQRVERMFGYPRAEVLGSSIELLLPESLRAAHVRHRDSFFAAPRVRPMGQGLALSGRRRDGTEFPIEVSLSFVHTAEGVLALSFVTDITARRAAEKALEKARRIAHQRERLADVGALTAKIVHDLGNPIAGLSMSTQQIARRLARNSSDSLETIRAPTEHMVAAVKRLDALTQDFKTFLREQRLSPVRLALDTFLREIASVWEPEARRRKIAIEVAPLPQPLAVRGDPDQLRRLFDNLVKNALEAVGRGPGRVTLSAAAADERVCVSVQDTGPGVSAGARVFDLFESTKPEGTGLGLTIARQIAEAHGGGIDLASAEPHGAVFHVYLPRT